MNEEDLEIGDDTLDIEQPGGYDQLPTAAWIGGRKNGAMPPGDVVAYLAIRRFGTMRKGRAIPSRQEMANDMGITVRAVDDRLNGLIEGGWLLITPRYRDDGQGQTSNHYSLLWEPITSADDPRLVEHKRRVAAFEAWMARRMAANAEEGRPAARPRSIRAAEWDADLAAKRLVYWGRRKLRGGQGETLEAPDDRGAKETARGGGENCADPEKDSSPLGAKKTAPLESHPSSHSSEPHENHEPAAAASPDADVIEIDSKAKRDPKVQAVYETARAVVTAYMDWWKVDRGVPADLPLPDGTREFMKLVGARPKPENCQYVTAALLRGYTRNQVATALGNWASGKYNRGEKPQGLVPSTGAWTSALAAVVSGKNPDGRSSAYSNDQWKADPTGGWGDAALGKQ